ncbi:hypothetical protein AcV5_000224 [Taiwanofungus camphoratus]|nr:hypothetical protein AcV5_000224 [Antrodia cinnamomea]
MVKKRSIDSDDDYRNDSDESYRAEQVKTYAKKTNTRRGAIKKRKRVDSDSVEAPDSSQIKLHPVSWHTIRNPEPLRIALLEWYADVHTSRGMPWRKPYDPKFNAEGRAQRAYEVWISEIMLQQTQVATVIPYYNKWMAKYPTIRDLAASDIETVNSLWKGLGYYSRAARLLSGAKKAVEQFGGRLPDNAKDMESKIPGIGRYSAGAICSIAYNQCVPVLDGNVHRLLSRVLALHAPPKGKRTLDILWQGAIAMVEGSTCPGDLNQALIELGATVCKVRDPTCGSCPLRTWCRAYQHQTCHSKHTDLEGSSSKDVGGVPDVEELCTLCEPLPTPGRVTMFPMKVEKKKAREELDIVNVIEWRSQRDNERWFLLVRRPEGGLLAGLHEFPTSPNVPVTSSAAALIEIPHTLLSDLLASPPEPYLSSAKTSEDQTDGKSSGSDSPSALRIEKIKPVGDVIHVFSHIKKTYRVQWVVLEGGGDEPPPLAPLDSSQSVSSPTPKRKAKGGSKKGSNQTSKVTAGGEDARGAGADAQSHAAWTPIDEVANAKLVFCFLFFFWGLSLTEG